MAASQTKFLTVATVENKNIATSEQQYDVTNDYTSRAVPSNSSNANTRFQIGVE